MENNFATKIILVTLLVVELQCLTARWGLPFVCFLTGSQPSRQPGVSAVFVSGDLNARAMDYDVLEDACIVQRYISHESLLGWCWGTLCNYFSGAAIT